MGEGCCGCWVHPYQPPSLILNSPPPSLPPAPRPHLATRSSPHVTTWTSRADVGTSPGEGGHSPWFWVPIAKRTSEDVAVNVVQARKRGAFTDPSTLRRGLSEGAFSVGAVACLVQGKHPGLAIIGALIDVKRVIVLSPIPTSTTFFSPILILRNRP